MNATSNPVGEIPMSQAYLNDNINPANISLPMNSLSIDYYDYFPKRNSGDYFQMHDHDNNLPVFGHHQADDFP